MCCNAETDPWGKCSVTLQNQANRVTDAVQEKKRSEVNLQPHPYSSSSSSSSFVLAGESRTRRRTKDEDEKPK
jgi:hypothetical protein